MPQIALDLLGRTVAAYLATPGRPAPGVLVLHEAFGLNTDIRRITDRVAGLGYVALAPDLVEGGRVRCLAQAFQELRAGQGPLIDDAMRSVAWLKARPDVVDGRVGVIGFCLGGGFAFLLGLTGEVKAIAPNYGQAPDAASLARACPTIASYGGRDRFLRKEPARVDAALTSAGVPHEVKVYDSAGHSFMNQVDDHRISRTLSKPFLAAEYHPEAAEDTWRRIEAFFAEHV